MFYQPTVVIIIIIIYLLKSTVGYKKMHTWSTREQEQDKKGTENWRLHFAHKNKKNKHSRCKNNYDYAYRKNLEKSTRLSDRLNLDNVYSKSFIARAMDPHSSLRFSRGHL